MLSSFRGGATIASQSSNKNDKVVIGIDVGTGSARAGVFNLNGHMLGTHSHTIQIHQPNGKHDFYEQSSDDIWKSICESVKIAMKEANVGAESVVGIGFDATCSLVVLDKENNPLSVDPDSETNPWNVIVWLDHRATSQAAKINKGGHRLLQGVGGVISPEMEMPKISWLKENLPKRYQKIGKLFDLADYLVYRSTGDDVRSLCTVVCKWNYDISDNGKGLGWDRSFLNSIGLSDLTDEQIGKRVRPMGEPVGNGLNKKAASELGLLVGTPVGVGMIDAHAGGIGCLGARLANDNSEQLNNVNKMLESRMALICGTSTCHMASSINPVFVHGVWGPYYSAMIPNLWLNEGGQSTTGKLMDHIITSHPAFKQLNEEVEQRKINYYFLLNEKIEQIAKRNNIPIDQSALLTKDLHVYPDFFGNRSPLADPYMKGGIIGLTLSNSVDDLALLYLATVQAIAYGTRHIIESMEASGHTSIRAMLVAGGQSKNPLIMREHADATGCKMYLPLESEAVLLGSAMLGATASNEYSSLQEAMIKMSQVGSVINENHVMKNYHDAKYKVFRKMADDQISYRSIMENYN